MKWQVFDTLKRRQIRRHYTKNGLKIIRIKQNGKLTLSLILSDCFRISCKSDILLIKKEKSRNENDNSLLPTKNIEIVTIHPSEKIMSQTYLMCAIVAGSIGGVIIASVIICLTAYRLIKRDMGSYSIPNKHHF